MLGGDTVHYLWHLGDQLSEEVRGHLELITEVARSLVALGWGIDIAVGHGAIILDEQVQALPGEQWLPVSGNADEGLRVPVSGTLDDLIHRYDRFLKRIGSDGFMAPPPLSVYRLVDYRRATDPPERPIAAFSMLKPDNSGFRAFDTARQALTVSGMMRHATRLAAGIAGWCEPKINAFILGHGEERTGGKHESVGPKRFAFVPLPSIEFRGQEQAHVVGSVRRGIIMAFADDCSKEIVWARGALSGRELIREDNRKPVAILSLIPSSDPVIRSYREPAASWSTVTPVVLPGYDDPAHYRRRLRQGAGVVEQHRLLGRLSERIDSLLRKAIVQAGLSQVLADHAEIAWRKVGFWPGTDLVDRYGVPGHLKRYPRYHVRVKWRDINGSPVQVPGPICIGGGRFYGLGLFAGLPGG
jgi:CRISPR-associated protein Csb2